MYSSLVLHVLSVTSIAAPLLGDTNAVFSELLTEGVAVAHGRVVRLNSPSMPDGLDPRSQRKLLEDVAGRYSVDLFTRKSKTAPFSLKIAALNNEQGQRIGQTVDLSFVAYGRLETIDEGKLFEDLANMGNVDAESHELTSEELQASGISTIKPAPGLQERYFYFKGPLLERVLVSGVLHSVVIRLDKSTLVAGILDDRFVKDRQFSSSWQSRSRDESGALILGPPDAYSGLGGYAKATKLQFPEGALLVEFHVVFSEPHGWFRGANLLGSKLPIIIQEKVRSFRDQLSKREQ